MLNKITIENFFSVADRQEITFAVPGNAPDLTCFRSSPSDKNLRFPTAVGFFGSNASGKTTILKAAINMVMFACKSFGLGFLTSQTFQPYRRKDWVMRPTKIILEFDGNLSNDTKPVTFRYELHILHSQLPNDFQNKVVSYEALFYAPEKNFRCLFERKEQTFRFGSEFGISNNNDPRKQSIRPNASVISTLAMLNHPLANYLKEQMDMLLFTGFAENQSATSWLLHYAQDKKCLESLKKELRRIDIGLDSMFIEQGERGLFAKFQHVGLDGFIFLGEESKGTQRFIQNFLYLHYALETGRTAIIDEIDDAFHPLLFRELLRWFSSPERNPKGAQLLFTAHNPALLDELEKEQVFFTEKLCGEPTHVYSARDIKGLRREPSLMKKYLAGELGAVPHIG